MISEHFRHSNVLCPNPPAEVTAVAHVHGHHPTKIKFGPSLWPFGQV